MGFVVALVEWCVYVTVRQPSGWTDVEEEHVFLSEPEAWKFDGEYCPEGCTRVEDRSRVVRRVHYAQQVT